MPAQSQSQSQSSTNTKELFALISSRPVGSSLTISFSSQKEADTFRVAAYSLKRKTSDTTILISRNGSSVTLSKTANVATITEAIPGEAPTTTTATVISTSQKLPIPNRDEILREALEMKETLGWDDFTYKNYIKAALGDQENDDILN